MHNFTKTKSSDYIMPDITSTKNFKNKNKNLQIIINNDSNNLIQKNINFFTTFSQSNFSTTINSLNNNISRILKSSLSYNNLNSNNGKNSFT